MMGPEDWDENPYDESDEPFYTEYEIARDAEEERRLRERGAL